MADFDESVLDCAKDRGESSIWTICALASVVGRDIKSIYPAVNGIDDVPVCILNVILQPRQRELDELQPMLVMWTRAKESVDIPLSPNHFSPLVNFIQLSNVVSIDHHRDDHLH